MQPVIKIPAGKNLYPFQTETIEKTIDFLKNGGGCYVANEQGLGKSVTTLVTAETIGLSPILIVCPAVMRLTWEQEIYSWCRFSSTSAPKVAVIESEDDISLLEGASYVIISYALLIKPALLRELSHIEFELIVLDEAQNIKNYKSKRTAAAKALCSIIPYKILLSGTPFSTNVIDGYVPFSILAPEDFPSYIEFGNRYSECIIKKIPKWTYNAERRQRMRTMLEVREYYGIKNAEELREKIRSKFYIRYKKEEVLHQLPPKIFQKIILPESYSLRVQAREYQQLLAERALLWESVNNDKPIVVPPYMAQHRKLQGLNKTPAVVEFARDKLEDGIPIVLFAHHKEVIERIKGELSVFSPVVITGDTSNADRQKAINAFQEGETNLFIGNLIAAGTGITLHRSSTVILGELDFVPSTIAQAIDRVDRIGQKNQVIVYYFVVANSLDEQLESLIIKRAKEFSSVLDEPKHKRDALFQAGSN